MTVRIEKIQSDLAWHDFVALRMLRRWVAARDAQECPLHSLVALGREFNLSFDLAVAFDGLFQLVEDCLGRALRTECCCGREMGTDERAVLILIAIAQQVVVATNLRQASPRHAEVTQSRRGRSGAAAADSDR